MESFRLHCSISSILIHFLNFAVSCQGQDLNGKLCPVINVENAVVAPRQTTANTLVNIECNSGYTRADGGTGPSSHICFGSKQDWIPPISKPMCKKELCCPNITTKNTKSPIHYGQVDKRVNSYAVIICPHGWLTESSRQPHMVVKCTQSLTWSPAPQSCTLDAPNQCKVPNIKNGKTNINDVAATGTSIVVTCNSGWQLGPSQTGVHLCSPGGTWNPAISSSICQDEDECDKANGGCQHNCQNLQGSFKCTCRSGYILSNNQRSCSPQAEVQMYKKPDGYCKWKIGTTPIISSLRGCKRMCTRTCAAITYRRRRDEVESDLTRGKCWLFTNVCEHGTGVDVNSYWTTTTYTKTPISTSSSVICSSSSSVTSATPKPGRICMKEIQKDCELGVTNSRLLEVVSSLEECLRGCIRQSYCRGISWRRNRRCYHFKDLCTIGPDAVASVRNFIKIGGPEQYRCSESMCSCDLMPHICTQSQDMVIKILVNTDKSNCKRMCDQDINCRSYLRGLYQIGRCHLLKTTRCVNHRGQMYHCRHY